MKRKTYSFTGVRPIFTGSPSIVQGGFNLDVTNQHFDVGDVIPAGSLAIRDEVNRTVKIVKTATVTAVSGTAVTLKVDEFYAPIFAVGEMIQKTGAAGVAVASAPTITAIEKKEGSYKITLSAAISGLAQGDVIEAVVSDGAETPKTTEIGKANCVTICDVVVSEFETAVDVSADTMQYAMYERRVPPIPASQKDASGSFLSINSNVKFTQSL